MSVTQYPVMRLLKRPSFYFACLPIAAMMLGELLHTAMGCGYECSGPISGPVDRVALGALYLFGYGFPLFMGLAALVLFIELIYVHWKKRRTTV